jgi:hypothetical protein
MGSGLVLLPALADVVCTARSWVPECRRGAKGLLQQLTGEPMMQDHFVSLEQQWNHHLGR